MELLMIEGKILKDQGNLSGTITEDRMAGIGDPPLTRKETLNFMIVKSDSPYNMLLGRTTMQKMEIMVSTIHGAIKFHTTRGIDTVFSTHKSDKVREGMQKSLSESSYQNTSKEGYETS
ncbi:hypothetical protein Tco_0274032 [Tanacetum coccineum]